MENRFSVGDKDYFIKVTPKNLADAKRVHNKAFREALEDGALLRKSLMNHMREQGVWDDKKEAQYQEFIKQINDLEYTLSSGKMKVSEGRAVALNLAQTRAGFRDLIAERNSMDVNTAEGQADNARFNFLLSACIFDYDTQKPVYSSLDEYVANGSDTLAVELAGKFANYLYGIDEKYEDNLVENKFLKRFKLIDDKGRFLNKNGDLVDVDGKRVDEDGFYIDSNGNRIDNNGHRLDVDIDTAEFEQD